VGETVGSAAPAGSGRVHQMCVCNHTWLDHCRFDSERPCHLCDCHLYIARLSQPEPSEAAIRDACDSILSPWIRTLTTRQYNEMLDELVVELRAAYRAQGGNDD
jgi:hypothetical protein